MPKELVGHASCLEGTEDAVLPFLSSAFPSTSKWLFGPEVDSPRWLPLGQEGRTWNTSHRRLLCSSIVSIRVLPGEVLSNDNDNRSHPLRHYRVPFCILGHLITSSKIRK